MFSRFAEAFTENAPLRLVSDISIAEELRGLSVCGLCDKAMGLMLAKKYPDAITYLDEAIRRPVAQENAEDLEWQKMAHILRALDNLYMSTYKGVIHQAFEDLRRVYNADQTQAVSFMCDSLDCVRQGKLDEARSLYNRALRRMEVERPATNLLGFRLIHGEFLRLLKNSGLALEDFLEADKLKSDNPFILSRIGLSYASSRNFARAGEFLRRAIEQCRVKAFSQPLIIESAQRTLENVEASLRGQVPPHARYRSSSASSAGSAGGGVAAPPAQPQAIAGVNLRLEPVRSSIKSLKRALDGDASETTPRQHIGTPHPQLPPRRGAVPSSFGLAAAPSPTSSRHLPPRHSPAAKTQEAEVAPAQLPKEAPIVSLKPAAAPASREPAAVPKDILPKPSPISPPRSAAAQASASAEGTGASVQERLKAFSGQPPKAPSPSDAAVKAPASAGGGIASAEAGRLAPIPKASPKEAASPSAQAQAQTAQPMRIGGSAGLAQMLRQQAEARRQGQGPEPGTK